MKQKLKQKDRENATARRAPTRHGRAPAHGCASGARSCVRCTAARVPVCAVGHVSARGARPCHPCGTPVCSPTFLCFANLGARDFLEPLIFLEITREVFFSVET